MNLYQPTLRRGQIHFQAGTLRKAMTLAALLALVATPGCGKKIDSANPPAQQTEKRPSTESVAALQPVLTAWEHSDKSAAVNRFLETDWTARPLFAPSSILSLSEDDFKSLSATERDGRMTELTTAADTLKKLASGVAQAGRDAAAKNDLTLARKHFTALNQYGEALDSPNSLALVQLVGKAVKKMADAEANKLPR